jgi:uncharacterized protein (TIGR00369 family)
MTPGAIQAIIHAGVPLAGLWRIEVLEAAGGTARLLLPADPALLRPGGTVSGPALMGLADVAFWAALLGISAGEDRSVTASMAVTFLRPAGPGPVWAEARLVKRGRRLLYGEVWLRGEHAADPCAHATASWAALG